MFGIFLYTLLTSFIILLKEKFIHKMSNIFTVKMPFHFFSSGTSIFHFQLWISASVKALIRKWNNHHQLSLWRTALTTNTIGPDRRERVQFDPRNPSVCQNLRAVFTLHTKTLMHPAYGQNVILSTFCSHFILFFGRRRAVTSCSVQKVIFVARETAERSANSWIRFEKSLISSDKQRWTPAPLLLYI